MYTTLLAAAEAARNRQEELFLKYFGGNNG